MNNTLENALKETWLKKDKFYEENKNLSTFEILINLENKYGDKGVSHKRAVTAPVSHADMTPLKRLGVLQ
jgi:hypothetical protein